MYNTYGDKLWREFILTPIIFPASYLPTALREALYGQGTSLPYRITACQLNATPLYVSQSR
jgi:hypothetical protein